MFCADDEQCKEKTTLTKFFLDAVTAALIFLDIFPPKVNVNCDELKWLEEVPGRRNVAALAAPAVSPANGAKNVRRLCLQLSAVCLGRCSGSLRAHSKTYTQTHTHAQDEWVSKWVS